MTKKVKFDNPIKADDIVHTFAQWEEVQAVIGSLLARNEKLEKVAEAAARYFTEDVEEMKYLNPRYFRSYTKAKEALEALENGE